jgi:CRISPR-associated protein Csb2
VLAIKVEYLTGVCMATRHNDPSRSTPEWPPHPDRLYSALVAAAAEPASNGNQDTIIPDGAKVALKWLAEQGAAQLAASEKRQREAPEVHMPTNPHEDEVWQKPKKGKPRALQKSFDLKTLLPVHRKKAALPIPAVIPDDPAVYFIWPAAEPDSSMLSTLKTICERVTYLGRSRSLVRVSLADTPPPATHVPDSLGQVQLRVPGPDRLCYLIDKYQRDGGKPEPSPPRRYRVVEQDQQQEVLRSTFDRMFIFRPQAGDLALPAVATLKVTKAFRQGLLRCVHERVCQCGGWVSAVPRCSDALDCYRKIPTLLSGYDMGVNSCTPTKSAHLAFVALPFVHESLRHADGSIKGLAVLVPRDPEQQALQLLATGLIRLSEVGLPIPGVGTWRLEEVPADNPPLQTLDMRSWTGPSRVWATVTPMVFGHVPKEKNGGEPAAILESLRMIGRDLPDTVVELAVGRHSPLHGAAPSWQFKPRPDGATGEPAAWMLRHVTLRFNQDVRGPLVLGRMRYFGLGLMRPMEERAWPS